jgi:transcription antitermination factor NusG
VQKIQKVVEPETERLVITSGWHILRCLSNVEIQISIMLNVRGYESFCPAEYRPQRTNRMENGRRVMETRARAMITGYGFVRFDHDAWDFDGVRRVKGVIDFMKIEGKPAGLHDHEIDRFKALDAAEFIRHQREMARKAADEAARLSGKPEVTFEQGKQVRVDGPLGEAWIGVMMQQRGAGRVAILRENAKIIVPHNRIHGIEPATCV